MMHVDDERWNLAELAQLPRQELLSRLERLLAVMPEQSEDGPPHGARVSEQSLVAQSEERYRFLAEYSTDLISKHAPDGTYVYASPAARAMLGYDPQEFLGRKPLDFCHPDDAKLLRKEQQLQQQPNAPPYDTVTYRHRRGDGAYLWLETTNHAIRDSEGKLIETISNSRDVTYRKESERRLQRTERLAAIGTLAAGIAHEINNPVGAALMSAETALRVLRQPNAHEIIEDCLKNVVASANRCGEIVRNLVRFARQEPTEKTLHDLNRLVRRACDLARRYADSLNATLVEKLDAKLPMTPLNALELELAVVNVIRNAIESGPKGVEVVITTSHDQATARIAVSDNGRGMTDEEMARVFEPFYSTRYTCGGTGLGMSTTYGIVQAAGGAIALQSEVGRGTTVTIELPLQNGTKTALQREVHSA